MPTTPTPPTFLAEPPPSEAVEHWYDGDRRDDGYVGNSTRAWCWRPDFLRAFLDLRGGLTEASALQDRDLAVLVASAAGQRRDSYCALAWGQRLAQLTDPQTAAAVIGGTEASALSRREQVLAAWARQVVADPNGATQADVDRLRSVGLGDREIFEATAFIALRLAFSTINDALGAHPDKQLADGVPQAVRAAVQWGRAPAREPSQR